MQETSLEWHLRDLLDSYHHCIWSLFQIRLFFQLTLITFSPELQAEVQILLLWKVFFALFLSMALFLLVPWFLGFLFSILLGLGAEAQEQAPMTKWTTAYSIEGEHQIVRNGLLTTVPKITKEWRVGFEVKPTDFSFRSYASVLHMTIGGKGVGSSAKVSD